MPKRTDLKKIMVIGSGPIIIGQACEFDYSGSQACKALKGEGYEVVLVNSNPATIMTDPEMADKVYIEPLTPETVKKIIEKELPEALLPTLGGQTGLNIAATLVEQNILEKYNVELIGAKFEAIKKAEDRILFKNAMEKIGLEMPKSKPAYSVEEAIEIADEIGYPVVIRPAYTLGGTGGGIAYNQGKLREIVARGIQFSRIGQVLIEESVMGWKEYELEVMRDLADNVVVICSIENMDPMGIHTGDSITVAPAQTLTDKEYQRMRDYAIKIIREIGVETGGSNIQFAVHPDTGRMVVIEMNPRVSRSSALASKATGFPIAKIAAKLAVGLTLDEIPNDITKETPASFEPTIDYVVVKIPRWPFDKFRDAEKEIGTQMKSTGEVMAIGRTFEEALQKAIRSLDINRYGLGADGKHEPTTDLEELKNLLKYPTDMRIFYIRDALAMGMNVDKIYELTGIDPWFLFKIRNIVELEKRLRRLSIDSMDYEIIMQAKKYGFSDKQLAYLLGSDEDTIRNFRKKRNIKPVYKMVDTCAAEFAAVTPYYYSSYDEVDEVKVSKGKKIIIIGGGPIRIAQGIEFDYCCVHGVISLREEGWETIIINNNPETVSTDYDTSDKLYFEPLTFEDVMNVIEKEKPYGVIVQFGGQTPLNLAIPLAKAGVNIIGTSPDNIDKAEDRGRFTEVLKKLGIPQAPYGTGFSFDDAKEIAERIGYPVLVRPSYVLGGRAMEIVYDENELKKYIQEAVEISEEHPVLVDKFLQGATEIDVDAISDGKDVFIGGIMEHIEHAGIHSGDSACVLPPQTLSKDVLRKIKEYTISLAHELEVIGLLNIQYAVKDGIVYVLEANPRASRTIPYVSKSIGVPMAKIAAKVMIGKKLRGLGYVGERKIRHVTIKEAVFPFVKLPGVDPILGPEMKSTGEVMGIDFDFGKAYYKAQVASGNVLPTSGKIFISIPRKYADKIAQIGERFHKIGFDILATEGTLSILEKNKIPGNLVKKIREGSPHILDLMMSKDVDLIINTPTEGKVSYTDGFYIRRHAVDLGMPYITTITGAEAAAEAIESMKKGEISIRSIGEYHKWHVHELRLEDFG
jgi:carbamoyl-phosphate synthase large subunit